MENKELKSVREMSWEEITRPLKEAMKKSDFKESDVVDLIHKIRAEKRAKNFNK